MWDQVSSNIKKSWALLFVFLVMAIAISVVFAVVLDNNLIVPIAVVIAVLMTVGSYYNSDKIVLAMSGAKPAEGLDYKHLVDSVEGIAMAAGIPKPRVYVIDDIAPNAFATGRDPEHAVVCVTTGLMEKLNRVEVEGVVAHELSHIKNYDIRFSTLVVMMVGIIALLSDLFLRSLWWGGGGRRSRSDRKSGNSGVILLLIGLALAILAPISAALLQAALSRQREYLADANGALLTRYPEGLASALEKISADPVPLQAANKATASLFICNPLKNIKGMFNRLYDTHPPIEERVRRLRTM